MAKLFANSEDPDQMPCSVASDLGLHCLPITLLRVSRLQWVKQVSQGQISLHMQFDQDLLSINIFHKTKQVSQWAMKTLIRQHKYVGWSGPLMLTYDMGIFMCIAHPPCINAPFVMTQFI